MISFINQVLLDPILYNLFGISVTDPTYHRHQKPYSKHELIYRNSPYKFHLGKVRYSNGLLKPAPSENNFIVYQILYNPLSDRKRLSGIDFFWCHGMGDYGGRFLEICHRFIQDGARIIIPDFPSFGRSSGLHGYIPSADLLIDTIHLVLHDISIRENSGEDLGQNHGRREFLSRKLILGGGSMGGYTALAYSLKHAGKSPYGLLSGVLTLCPMTMVASESRPSLIVEYIAKGLIKLGLGRLPVSPANKGKNSGNPQVEIDFQNDPQTYHGWIRVGTGLAFLSAMKSLENSIHNFPSSVPLLIIHGDKDRVVELSQNKKVIDIIRSNGHNDSNLIVAEGCEHDLLRESVDKSEPIFNHMSLFMERCLREE